MKLAVVEVLDRDNQARRAVAISSWPVDIGRAVDCDVVLDDPHVAAHHVTVSETDGVMLLQVGDSVNGVQWTNTSLRSGQSAVLPSGEIFQVGATRLRVRRPTDALPPERALFPEPPPGRVPLPALIAALVAWTLGAQWLTMDPGGRLTDYVQPLIGLVLGLVVWCGLWALTSKLFRHRFEFWPHVRIASRYLLGVELVGLALPVLAFMLGWTLLSRIAPIVAGAVTCAMIVAHLARILPSRRRLLAVTLGALFAAGTALMCFMSYQNHDRLFEELYVSTIAPPALRLASPVQSAQFIEEARSLKSVLDAHLADDDGGGMEGFLGGDVHDSASRNRVSAGRALR